MVAKLLSCPCCSLFFLVFHMFADLHHWHSSHQHPKICSHGIKKWIWTETRVTWCILWAEEFSSLPGLHPCCLTRWTLVPRQAVTHIKTSFLDSFTNVTLTNTKSNNLSLLSVSHLLYKGGLWGKHLLQYCCRPPTKLRRKAGVNPTWRHLLVWRYCCHLHLVLAVCGAIGERVWTRGWSRGRYHDYIWLRTWGPTSKWLVSHKVATPDSRSCFVIHFPLDWTIIHKMEVTLY